MHLTELVYVTVVILQDLFHGPGVTGAVKNAVILSVPEGHDKPLKYPLIFTVCDVLLINKTDVLPYFDFDMEKVIEYAHRRNPKLEIFPVSAKTGEGMDAWCDWLRKQVKDWQT